MNNKNILIAAIAVGILGISVLFCLKMSKIDDMDMTDTVDTVKVIATINGDEIYQSDYDRVKELNFSLTDEQILKLIMKELLVYQEAYRLGFSVDTRELDERINQLKEQLPDMYDLCIEQYGSEDAYRTALSYTILYNMVYNYYTAQFLSSLDYDIDAVTEEIVESGYASLDEMNETDKDQIIVTYLSSLYKNDIRSYFDDWNEQQYECAEIRVEP